VLFLDYSISIFNRDWWPSSFR